MVAITKRCNICQQAIPPNETECFEEHRKESVFLSKIDNLHFDALAELDYSLGNLYYQQYRKIPDGNVGLAIEIVEQLIEKEESK